MWAPCERSLRITGIILYMRPANERWRYFVTSFLIYSGLGAYKMIPGMIQHDTFTARSMFYKIPTADTPGESWREFL